MPIYWLPLLLFLLPAIGAHGALWISQTLDLIPVCNPYVAGCTSISAAGRNEPAIFLFRGLLMPKAVLLALFWPLYGHWLRCLGARPGVWHWAIGAVGISGTIFLLLYLLFLGTEGEVHRLLRRYGVHLYFFFTYSAQVLATWRLHRLTASAAVPAWLVRILIAQCLLMLVIGAVAVPAAEWWLDRSQVNNAMAWNMGALGMSWFLVAAIAWRQTGFQLDGRTAPRH
jgi:hypothetical protein